MTADTASIRLFPVTKYGRKVPLAWFAPTPSHSRSGVIRVGLTTSPKRAETTHGPVLEFLVELSVIKDSLHLTKVRSGADEV